MGNRAWLYLVNDASNTDSAMDIAESNNLFPSLWRVLLSESAAGEAVKYQRVFGDEETPALLGDARMARLRLGMLAQFIKAYPLPGDPVELPQHLDALIHGFDDQIAAVGGTTPMFSADLDELFSAEGGEDPGLFIEVERWVCAAVWAAIDRRIAAGDSKGVRMALGLPASASWADWDWLFGFGGLSESAFGGFLGKGQVAEPAGEASSRDLDEWTHLHGDVYRSWNNGRVVLARREGEHWKAIPVPQWDAIWGATADDPRLHWVARDQSIGLVSLDRDGVREMHSCVFKEVRDFVDGVAVVRQGKRTGLMRLDGTWQMEPVLEHLDTFAYGLASARQGGRCGLIDAQGRWVIRPEFDEVQSLADTGLALVRQRRHWGVLTHNNVWLVPATWNEIEWQPECDAFVATGQDGCGLIHRNGRVLIDPVYDDVWPFGSAEVIEALRAQSMERFVVRDASGYAVVVDDKGQRLTPSGKYVDMTAFDWLLGGGEVPAPVLARYAIADSSEDEIPSVAVYDIVSQAEVFRGEYEYMHALHWGNAYGWLVVQQAEDGHFRAGVIDAGGRFLHAMNYWWIGTYIPFQSEDAVGLIPYEIVAGWRNGDPVIAMRQDGQAMYLYADGRAEHRLDGA